MNKLIQSFVETFCIAVSLEETTDYVELMMDNHKCIVWEGKQYYMPENNSSYTEVHELIYTHLEDNHIFKLRQTNTPTPSNAFSHCPILKPELIHLLRVMGATVEDISWGNDEGDSLLITHPNRKEEYFKLFIGKPSYDYESHTFNSTDENAEGTDLIFECEYYKLKDLFTRIGVEFSVDLPISNFSELKAVAKTQEVALRKQGLLSVSDHRTPEITIELIHQLNKAKIPCEDVTSADGEFDEVLIPCEEGSQYGIMAQVTPEGHIQSHIVVLSDTGTSINDKVITHKSIPAFVDFLKLATTFNWLA